MDNNETIRSADAGVAFQCPTQCSADIIVFQLKQVYPQESLHGSEMSLSAPA